MRSYYPDVRSLFPALDIIDDFVAQWQRSFTDHACKKGCSVCCTDRVTVTEAEAARILARYPPEEHPWTSSQKRFPSSCTTNEFAISCLQGIGQEASNDFPETPGICPFLSEAKECSVYPARPLMCRLFISTAPCEEKGEATIPELAFFTQIILQQLTEHLSRGSKWGNLAAMLRYCCHAGPDAHEGLRTCRQMPCFPFAQEEKRKLAPQLAPLFDRLKGGGWLPDNFNLDFESMDFD